MRLLPKQFLLAHENTLLFAVFKLSTLTLSFTANLQGLRILNHANTVDNKILHLTSDFSKWLKMNNFWPTSARQRNGWGIARRQFFGELAINYRLPLAPLSVEYDRCYDGEICLWSFPICESFAPQCNYYVYRATWSTHLVCLLSYLYYKVFRFLGQFISGILWRNEWELPTSEIFIKIFKTDLTQKVYQQKY